MPDIHGNYSPKEVAQEIGISTAWINKVQSKAGIPRPISTKGAEVRFDNRDLYELRQAYILRVLDYSFEEIKEIYSLEKSLVEIAHKNDMIVYPDSAEKDILSTCRCIIYLDKKEPFELAANTFLVGIDVEKKATQPTLAETAGLKKYCSEWVRLVKIQCEILKRAKKMQDKLDLIVKQATIADCTNAKKMEKYS